MSRPKLQKAPLPKPGKMTHNELIAAYARSFGLTQSEAAKKLIASGYGRRYALCLFAKAHPHKAKPAPKSTPKAKANPQNGSLAITVVPSPGL